MSRLSQGTCILNYFKVLILDSIVYIVQEKVIANERQRRKERLASARENDVWHYRTSAPKSFSEPLPEHMLRNAVPRVLDKSKQSSCLIS